MLEFLVHSPVAFYGQRTPERPALCCRGESLSWAELDARSNELAQALIASGLGGQDRVGIFMNKGLDMGVAIYGALKAGGAFVPLDPLLPVERLAFIVGDCGIRHIVSGDTQAASLRALANVLRSDGHGLTDAGLPTVYGVEGDVGLNRMPWSEVRQFPREPVEVSVIDQDLAYIMYTSGSTGEPKGMMHSHQGSLSYARWGALHCGLTADDRVASHAPLHFDLSIFDFFSTAQVGAAVVLVPEPITKFPASWTQYLEEERISIVFTVPFTLIEMLERGVMDERNLDSLRWVLFGGEPFPPKHLRELMARLPNTRFTNVYGPAEAPSCTCYNVPPLADDDEPIPIGHVSRNSKGLILDENDEVCAVGQVGELLIRSSTLTKGYWNRPELNDRVFVERPRFGRFRDTYFRTGDLVVRRDDGLLGFVGRKDRMVKTRGYRVELDEVEAALASHPAVSEAAAFTVPDGRGSNDILAAAVLQVGREATEGDLLAHSRDKIPGYAVPRSITLAISLPRTTSGKIDRKRLSDQAIGEA